MAAPFRFSSLRPRRELEKRTPGASEGSGAVAMKVLGVDPGVAGAAAVIEIVDGVDGTAPKLIDVIDIPILGVAAKTRIDAIGLRTWIETYSPDFAGIERAGSMPRQGVASAFKYGRAAGTIEAVVACCKVPSVLIEPSKWKRALHLNSEKEASRQLAIQLFPHAHDRLNLKRHHQRAEAMLIALFTANNRGAP
jgi:Holliday junction resolvasome RuvABC endonuclease subunit